ncbi:MAG: hypothetical protein PHX74_01775 [Candidatus Sumerlaeales bacterium]|nr:hypothetical protein [Candidatus Sumerlaeales bacterium]
MKLLNSCLAVTLMLSAGASVYAASEDQSIMDFYNMIGPSEILSTDDSGTQFRKTVHHYIASPVTIAASPVLGLRDGFTNGLADMSMATNPGERIGKGLLILPEALITAPMYLLKSGGVLSSLHLGGGTPTATMGNTYGNPLAVNTIQQSYAAGQAKPTAGMALNVTPTTGMGAAPTSSNQPVRPVSDFWHGLTGQAN